MKINLMKIMDHKLSFAIFFFLIAYYFPKIKIYFDDNKNVKIEQEIINSWKHLIRTPNREKPLRFSIGYVFFS